MAWNEPGRNNDDDDNKPDHDPWSDRGGRKGSSEMDETLQKLQEKLSGLFGGKGSKGGKGGKGDQRPPGAGVTSFIGIGIFFLVIVVIWFLFGFFVVQPAQRAVVLRFGKYQETIGPGLHWIPRGIESVYKVNIQNIYTYTYPSNEDAEMLTKDENIVAVAVTVQYRIANPEDFLFNVVNPVESLRQATASAMRQVVGLTDLDTILTTGREQVREDVKKTLQASLARYQSGIAVTDVAIKSLRAPDQVRDAFDDAVKAREDRSRYKNQAEAYAMKVEPIAKGQAQRILEAAKAYQQQVVLDAHANTASYLALLPEYLKAPGITRERLYLDALENVFKQSSKVLVDVKGSNNLIYLPLERLMKSGAKLNPPKTDGIDDNNSKASTEGDDDKAKTGSSVRPSRDYSGLTDYGPTTGGGY